MPSINVKFCIVCEDVRSEIHGKYSILGFFGLLPDVEIKVQELNKPIAQLVFLFNIYGDRGEYIFKCEIVDPKAKVVSTINLAPMTLVAKNDRDQSMAAIVLSGLAIASEGKHKIRLSHEGKTFFESTFVGTLGSPDLFNKS